MDIKAHTTPANLDKYSFLWSEARLIIAAVALFIGGVPPVIYFNPFSGLYGPVSSLLHLAWIISGLASVYMLYRWNSIGKTLFGKKEKNDMYAFFVSVISGINLGLTGILGNNIGMSIASSRFVFAIVGLLYLASAGYLWKRWKAHSQKIF